jgi:hypothetical protein
MAAPSIRLIVPFFGDPPKIIDLFLRSCEQNPTVNWLLISDHHFEPDELPRNVSARHRTFDDIKAAIERTLGIRPALTTAYKLCDFRPAFGVLFADEIEGFDFWGHCDLDVIFGDIRRFVTEEVLRQHSKVLINGHFSLYKNTPDANQYYQLQAPGVDYRRVFTSPESTAFDEFGGIKKLLEHHGVPIYRDDGAIADIDPAIFRFTVAYMPNHRHQCFFWESGRLFKAFWNGTMVVRQEYMYIHLQKRVGTLAVDVAPTEASWFITPYGCIPKRSDPTTREELDRLNPGNKFHDMRQYLASRWWHLKQAFAHPHRLTTEN